METVRAALDLGVRYVDTAPLYGAGASERIIGQALRGRADREEVFLATKVGYQPAGFDYRRDATVASIHASLERLGLERLSLVQIHEIREENFDAVFGRGGALEGLRRLQAEGLVGLIGVTGSEGVWLERAVQTREFSVVLPWKRADLLDDSLLASISPLARQLGMAVVAGTPYAGGLLALRGDEAHLERGYIPRQDWDETLRRVRLLIAACRRHGVELAAAALQYPVRRLADVLIPGAMEPAHVRENVARMAAPVPDELWDALEQIKRAWGE